MKVSKVQIVEKDNTPYENKFYVLKLCFFGLLWIDQVGLENLTLTEAEYFENTLSRDKETPYLIEWIMLKKDD